MHRMCEDAMSISVIKCHALKYNTSISSAGRQLLKRNGFDYAPINRL